MYKWISCFLFINKISFRSAWMSKASLFGTLIFAGCLLILFPFGLGTQALKQPEISIGSYWVINEFIAALTVSRMFLPEQESFALDFILSARNPRSAILAGKITFTALQIIALQIPITFFWIVLYNMQSDILMTILETMIPVTLLFSVGSASIGALVSCLISRSHAKDILQPILFFPLQSGILLAAVSLTMSFAQHNMTGVFSASAWWTILFASPVLFTTLGLLLSNILFQE